MKRIYTSLLFCLLAHLSIFGQNCPIPNGSFEEWDDVTLEIDVSGSLTSESIFLPTDFTSGFRLLFATFNQVFGNITDQDIAEEYFGLERSTDATDGEYALKIGGNGIFSLADAISVFSCDADLPTFLSLDLKHVGSSSDTFAVIITAGDNLLSPADPTALEASRGYVFEQFEYSEEADYTTIEIPFVDNNNGMSADSMFMWIIVTGNDESIANGEESYFLVDNMQFSNVSSTSAPALTEAVHLYPMPFIDHMQIDNENNELQGELYSIDGQFIKSIDVPKGTSDFDLRDIGPGGQYTLTLTDRANGRISSYPLIKTP